MSSLADLESLRRRISEEPRIKIEEAARLLGISTNTIRRRRHDFELVKVKGHLYVTARSLLRFMSTHLYSPSAYFDVLNEE